MEMAGPTAFMPVCTEYEIKMGTTKVLMNPRVKKKLPIPISIHNLTSPY
jgi:hypothetical protein